MPTDSISTPDPAAVRTAAFEPSRRACLTVIMRMTGLRPTRQRLDLADRLLGRDRHVTAEELYLEASGAGQELSLATVYNTLRQFQEFGLVRELASEGMCSVFDTDTSRHHHFYLAEEARIIDIPADSLVVPALADFPVPDDYEVDRIEVVVRLGRTAR